MSIRIYEGDTKAENVNIGIVVSKWNSMITEKMLDGALSALKSNGIEEDRITIVRCPGSFEIPLAAQQLFEQKEMDGIIAIGVVIRGGTPHFEYVCDAVTRGIVEVNLKYNKPVSFGVLTTDDVQQAIARAGDEGNKGSEAALALLEMVSLNKKIR